MKKQLKDLITARKRLVNCQLCSYDVTLQDYLMWRYLKVQIYVNKAIIIDQLKDNVTDVINEIKHNLLQKVSENYFPSLMVLIVL